VGDAVVERVRDEEQGRVLSSKPQGFWYGIGRDWIRHCAIEVPDKLRAVMQQVFVDESKILMLRTAADVLDFSRTYGVETGVGHDRMRQVVDWPRVAARYGGIEIAPYQSELRSAQETRWYYGWDVASGCVRDASAVRGLRVVATAGGGVE